jgi:hypothetical protein
MVGTVESPDSPVKRSKNMALNVTHEVAALQRMTVKELRAKFADVCGDETRSGNRAWLIKRIAWRMQANHEGGLTERARHRARELACDADLRLSAPRMRPQPVSVPAAPPQPITLPEDSRLPLPGTILVREYKGCSVQVRVLEQGFEYAGQTWRSLSAVAKAVTGTHINGFLFFKLQKGGRS